MRILLVHSAFVPPLGGAEAYVLTLLSGLRDRGHDVALATGEIAPGVVGRDVHVRVLNARNVYRYSPNAPRPPAAKAVWHLVDTFNPTVLPSLRATIRQFRPDVVHTHNFQGLGGAIFAALRSVPHVHTAHDYALVNPSNTLPTSFPVSVRLRNAALRALFRPDLVVFPSERSRATHESLRTPAPAVRTVVKPYGWPSPTNSMRDRGDESGPVTFLFLGRLTEAKGVPFLLEVWRSGMPAGVELLIAGDGPLASNVAAAASADATIRVVGWADADMKAKLLTTSDVLLHPSESEVCSLSASEAFLSGLPVISTPDAASPYASDGDNGRIVDRDVVAWRAAIVDMTDPSILRSMQSGARATAPRIDWTSHVADLESTYRCVVRDHGRCHV